MYATYHKEVNNPPKIGILPVNVFDLDDDFIYEHQLQEQYCSVDSNGFYTFLHLNNGDRIDIKNQ